MPFLCNVLADSISPDDIRYTTLEVEYPHAVHKDMLTHRMLERNFLSFRAAPMSVIMQWRDEDFFIPEHFQEFRKGMDVGDAVDALTEANARALWIEAKNAAFASWEKLVTPKEKGGLGINKGHANILIQDFCWIRGIISATEWENFDALRAYPPDNAKPRAEVMKIARLMAEARASSNPRPLDYGEVHLPLIRSGDRLDAERKFANIANDAEWKRAIEDYLLKVSTGKIARVSYLTHDGIRDLDLDIDLHDRLMGNGHMSPFGHPAWPFKTRHPRFLSQSDPRVGHVKAKSLDWRGPLFGWCSYRNVIPNESDFSAAQRALQLA